MHGKEIGPFGVPGESDNGRRAVELCVERYCGVVDNAHFMHRSMRKYVRVAGSKTERSLKHCSAYEEGYA